MTSSLERERERMEEEGSNGFLRANRIDLKSLDDQLDKHLARALAFENNKKEKRRERHQGRDQEEGLSSGGGVSESKDWEIDPLKLEIRSVIARGTHSAVHRGVYDGKDVAVKLLDFGEAASNAEALRAEFANEISVWSKLEHPNVTKFVGASMSFHVEEKDGLADVCCVVVEYINGGTLKSYLIRNRRRKLPFKVVIQLALELARGLRYLHSKKIMHRDVKTENILLDNSRTVKIADFGVARLEAQKANDMTGLTGTLGYMAPEVFNKCCYNKKCDVYSFGICLWEIYCCEMPYPELSFSEMASAIIRQNSRPKIPQCCPGAIRNLMKRCWDANPERRPEMDEVVSILEGIDTSKGGGMIPHDQMHHGCLPCLSKHQRGP